jgi:hypothetical protein
MICVDCTHDDKIPPIDFPQCRSVKLRVKLMCIIAANWRCPDCMDKIDEVATPNSGGSEHGK